MINIINLLSDGCQMSLKDKYGKEMIYIVPLNLLKNLENVFTPCYKMPNLYYNVEMMGRYVFRYDAAENNSLQQVVPSIVLQNNNGAFLVDKNEDKLSLIKTSYINKKDGEYDMIYNRVKRYLDDINIEQLDSIIFTGYLRDVLSINNDHLGLLFIVKVKDIHNIANNQFWASYDDLIDNFTKFNSWDRSIIDYMFLNQKELSFNNSKFKTKKG